MEKSAFQANPLAGKSAGSDGSSEKGASLPAVLPGGVCALDGGHDKVTNGSEGLTVAFRPEPIGCSTPSNIVGEVDLGERAVM